PSPPITPPRKPSARKRPWNSPAMKAFEAPMKCSTSTISRFEAIVPRVANTTASTVATTISTSTSTPESTSVPAMVLSCCRHAACVSSVAPFTACRSLASRSRSTLLGSPRSTTISRGISSWLRSSPAPSHGSSSFSLSARLRACASLTPGIASASEIAVRILLSITSPSIGRIWIVTCRPTSEDHAIADFCTSTTPPSVTPDRNVMMAISSTSVRPATERSGTMAAVRFDGGFAAIDATVIVSIVTSAMHRHLAVAQRHARKIERVEQAELVRRKNDGGAELVELGEQADQPQRQLGIHVARRLVGQEDIGPADHRARDRRALLLAARQQRRQRVHALAQPDPFEQFADVGAVERFRLAQHAQRQRHVLERRQVVEQAEFLEHDADMPAHVEQRILVELADIAPEHGERAAARLQRQQQQAQQRRLARPGRTGEKMERARL